MPIHIHYSKSFVAYLDVLGFKNLVKSNNITALNNYFNIINDELDQLSVEGHLIPPLFA